MRPTLGCIVALAVAFVVSAATATAAPRGQSTSVRILDPPTTAAPGQRLTVTVRGPRAARVRLFLTTRSRPARRARPLATARLRRGRARVSLTVPASLGATTRRLVACVQRGRRLRCGRAVALQIVPAPSSQPAVPAIPVPALYTITLQGAAGAGSGATPFTQNAVLVVTPTIDPAAATGNGVNPVDIGIKTAGSPIVGVAGALWFGTNLGVSAVIGSSPAVGPSAVDVAFVTVPSPGRVDVVLDGNVFGSPFARVNYLNIYNVQTSVVAQIHNVLAGRMTIEFLNGGAAIRGAIELGGSSGFGGPAVSSTYSAAFAGARAG